jgi:ABC-2 type transport system permease protein
MTVAVEGVEPGSLPPSDRLRFVGAPAEHERIGALSDGSLDGVLTRRPDGSFSLLVHKDPRYRAELEALLTEIGRRERLAARGLDAMDLAAILQPAGLEVRFTDPGRGRASRAEQLVAAPPTGIVILAVFTSMAYLLAGITGEKQLRVTESLVSFVSPQAWIDGKILGIAAYSLVNVANMLVGGLIVAALAQLAWGFSLPDVVTRPGVLTLLLVVSVLGLALWNAVFAAMAATLDDPNTSARTSLMFLPMLFIGLACWITLRDPDSTVARVIAVFPLTSSPALAVRAILSDVGPLEIAVSLTLLIATIWLVRRAAGRIFEIGMLMYGKEPSLREIARWARG